jgi:undecaprenyl-diphosphatase
MFPAPRRFGEVNIVYGCAGVPLPRHAQGLDSGGRRAERAGVNHRLSATFWILPALLAALFLALLAFGGPASGLDHRILLAAQVDGLVPAAQVVTDVGGTRIALGIAVAAAALMAWRGARRQALLLLFLLASQRLLVEGLKMLFDRARPDPHGHLVAVHSMAFPSGHAANAMSLALGLALLAPVRPERRPLLVGLALVFPLLIGLTRLVLGVHWPSDVAGGWALGALWTLLLVRLFGTARPARH